MIPLLSRDISERFSNVFIPQDGAIQMSDYSYHQVCDGQCDARSTVAFPAAQHNRNFAATKLYCLVTEAPI